MWFCVFWRIAGKGEEGREGVVFFRFSTRQMKIPSSYLSLSLRF